jgi:hypothetical protein
MPKKVKKQKAIKVTCAACKTESHIRLRNLRTRTDAIGTHLLKADNSPLRCRKCKKAFVNEIQPPEEKTS